MIKTNGENIFKINNKQQYSNNNVINTYTDYSIHSYGSLPNNSSWADAMRLQTISLDAGTYEISINQSIPINIIVYFDFEDGTSDEEYTFIRSGQTKTTFEISKKVVAYQFWYSTYSGYNNFDFTIEPKFNRVFEAKKIIVGNNEVSKIYLGNNTIYEVGGGGGLPSEYQKVGYIQSNKDTISTTYRKDSSQSSGNDSLQFKVRIE